MLLMAASAKSGWAIGIEASGRPSAYHPRSGSRLALSIAHTGAWIAAAVCDSGEIGIDIERRDPSRDHLGIAELAFGTAGRDMVSRGGADAFYRLWTLREAMGKATGEGLAMTVDATDPIAAGPHTGYWVAADSRWLLAHLELPFEVSLALAVRSEAPVAARDWRPRHYLWLNDCDRINASSATMRNAVINGAA